MQKIKHFTQLLLIVAVVCCSTPLLAQPPDGFDPVDVPVNGPALLLLAAAGVGYVVKKMSRKKKD
jgi:hypothetical protein